MSNTPRRKRRVPRWRRRAARVQWILAAVGAAVLAHVTAADEIALKRSVRLATGSGNVRLADIAELTGPRARQYADMVVAQVHDSTSAMEISVGEVRAALTDAGVHWGKVNLNGTTVIVRPGEPGHAVAPMFMTPASIEPVNGPLPLPSAGPGPGRGAFEQADTVTELQTLRGEVARIIVAGLGMAPEAVRLTFDDRDASLLDRDLDTNRFEIQPLSNLDSDRVQLSVRVWSQGRIVHRQSISVRLMIRTGVVVLHRDVNRGDVLHEENFLTELRWITPIQASTLCGFVEAVGRVAGMPLKAGDVLKKKHVKRDVLVRRGDRVIVRCLVGGVVISLDAEARSNGAEGDPVELRKLGERTTFMATVSGPGAAILDLAH